MDDILQQKLGVKMEYNTSNPEIKINMEGLDSNYYAKLNDIQIDPRLVDLSNLEIKKNSLKIDFKAPIICNNDNIDFSKSMMVGVKFEGEDKQNFIEKIEETAKNFGPEWEKAVLRRKEIIQKRTSTHL